MPGCHILLSGNGCSTRTSSFETRKACCHGALGSVAILKRLQRSTLPGIRLNSIIWRTCYPARLKAALSCPKAHGKTENTEPTNHVDEILREIVVRTRAVLTTPDVLQPGRRMTSTSPADAISRAPVNSRMPKEVLHSTRRLIQCRPPLPPSTADQRDPVTETAAGHRVRKIMGRTNRLTIIGRWQGHFGYPAGLLEAPKLAPPIMIAATDTTRLPRTNTYTCCTTPV